MQKIKGARTEKKVTHLFRQIKDLAYDMGPNAKLPTVRELCGTLGASSATITTALNELETQRIIYRKHATGIFVSPKLYSKNVSLVLGSSYFQQIGASPFWDMLWGLLMKEAARRAVEGNRDFNFHLALPMDHPGEALPSNLTEALDTGQVHGILGVGLDAMPAWNLTQQPVPFVAFAGNGRYQVIIDDHEVWRLGMEDLLRQGCRRIGMWKPVAPFEPDHSGNTDFVPFDIQHTERLREVRDLYCNYGLEFHEELYQDAGQLFGHRQGITHQEQGYRIAKQILGQGGELPLDGVIVTDDMMTLGVLVALEELNIRPGADIRIATHTNTGSIVLYGKEKKLTLIDVDPGEIARTMFDFLERLMHGDLSQEVIWVKPRLRL